MADKIDQPRGDYSTIVGIMIAISIMGYAVSMSGKLGSFVDLPSFLIVIGGTFAVKFDGISTAMAQQKVDNALNAGAEYIISTDASCLMHLQGYIDKNSLPITTMHLADVLASGWN